MADRIRVTLRQGQIRNFLSNPNGPVMRDLERRAQNVLQKARELAPEAEGTLVESLRIEKTTQRGKPIVRVTSNAPWAKAVIGGTGSYSGTPDYRPGSKLHTWATVKGIPTSAIFPIAKKIRMKGTVGESGNIVGNFRRDGKPQNWLTEALKEASR